MTAADQVRLLAWLTELADQRGFIGVISPIDPRIETPQEVRDRVLEAEILQG